MSPLTGLRSYQGLAPTGYEPSPLPGRTGLGCYAAIVPGAGAHWLLTAAPPGREFKTPGFLATVPFSWHFRREDGEEA